MTYLTTDQYKQGLQQAISQGIKPDDFLKTITDNGVIVQGYNDQQYQVSPAALNGDKGSGSGNQPKQSLGGSLLSGVGSFLGGAVKSLTSPIVEAVGTGLRGIQSIPAVAKQGLGLLTGNQQMAQEGANQADQIQSKPILGQNTFVGNTVEQNLGQAAKAASFLAPELGLGATATGAISGGIFASGESATHNASTNEILGSGAIGALGGAIIGKALSSLGGHVSGNYSGAVDNAESIIKRANSYRGSIPQDLIQGAVKLTTENPDAIVNTTKVGAGTIGGQMQKIIPQLSELNDATINNALSNNLTPSAVQTISSRLNTLASMSGEKTGVQLFGLNNEFRTLATQALDEVKPGVGSALQDLYKTATEQYNVYDNLMRTLEQKPGQVLAKQEADSLISSISKKAATPQGKIVLQRGLQDWAKSTGIDLSKQVSLAQYEAKAGPIAGNVIKTLLKYAGFGVAVELGHHVGL